ncbi:MAG: DUF1822 family protein [Leptolyngbyaceae cyanobacterium RU_5_1]|nr:DUF1822 family protein [Leptolyngbyaceae cyanobacterium RU_5_1]
MNRIEPVYITVPISRDVHRLAQEFAAQQATPLKGKQVYLNTLAIYAVHSYLNWLGIETDLEQGDSWQPGRRALFNIADLVLPGIGRLECRPVLPNQPNLSLPTEVRCDRIGYIAVQLGQSLDQVELLGFVPADAASEAPEELRLDHLQPLESLIDHLDWVESGRLISLRQWLQEHYEPGWQKPVELISTAHFRQTGSLSGGVSRAKRMELGTQWVGLAVVLLVQLTSTTPDEAAIQVRLYPTGESSYLPHDIQLMVLDDTDTVCLQIQASQFDDWIGLEFSGKPEEKFSIRVVLENADITEKFVI